MKILNAKLTKGGREYRASIAICKDMPVEEFMSLLCVSLPIPDTVVIGFKDVEGVLVIPSLICREPELLRSDDYELILKDKAQTSRPTSANVRQGEEQLSHILTELRLKLHLNEDEYSTLATWTRENSHTVHQILQNYIHDNNLEAFSDWVVNNSPLRLQRLPRTSAERPKARDEKARFNRSQLSVERPSTTRAGERPMTSNNNDRRGYQRFIQVVLDLEQRGVLDQKDLGVIKALILRDNHEVMRELGSYFMRTISLDELGIRLQRLADKLSSGMERPSSPMPRKSELHLLVESLVKENLPTKEDIEILNKLIADENEFVFSAFDVFESDRDQEELIDSLIRAISKYRKQAKQEPLPSNSFYPNPPPIEIAPQIQELNSELIWRIIQDFNIAENWGSEYKGVLRGLIQGSSKALYRAFEHFLKNEDNEVLEEQLKTICKLYYFLMLSQCFSSKQIKTIKKFTITTLTDIFEIFASDGDAYKFTNAIIETLNFKDVSLPRTRLWEHIFHMVEEEDETEDELDAYDTLTNILSNSARLSQYSHILTRLYEDQDPELLNVIENYLNGTSIELIEEIMLKIVKENNKENNIDLNLTEIVKNDFSQEKLSIIRRLWLTDNHTIISALEVFEETDNKDDLVQTLEILLENNPLSTTDENFLNFIEENFEQSQLEKLVKMRNEQDSRLKSAISLHDFATDKEELIETLSFLIRDDPN